MTGCCWLPSSAIWQQKSSKVQILIGFDYSSVRECRKTEDPLAQVAPCREVLDQCHPTLRRTTDEVLQRGLRELFEEHPVRQRFVDTDIAAADHYYEAIRTLFNAFRKPGGLDSRDGLAI